jgi:RNA polymerase sigma-70 factor (ECF subfamily)
MNSHERLLERVLILRCQTGDKDAFVKLIERYQAQLRYFISRLLENTQMTEDIFQDTWLAVIRRICSLKKADAFAAWLYRIARNKAYQHLRRKKRLSELEENQEAVEYNQDNSFSPEDAAKIHSCLKKLRHEHREVLMLRFLEEMSYEQIADVVNCSAGTVKSRIHYAKLALRKEMEK